MSEMMHVSQLTFDQSVYPRSKPNTHTVERYADAMRAGDVFPPIVVETGTNKIVDGVHRWKAAKLLLEDGKGFDGMIAVEFRGVPENIPTKLYAASLSARHGDRLSNGDCKSLARELVTDNPEFNTVTLSKYLGLSDETVRGYIGDILAKRREERSAKAERLRRLGWTQAEIGDALGVTQGRVSQDSLKIQEVGKLIIQQLADGHDVAEVANRNGVPVALVQAIALDGKTDAERFSALGINCRPYDVWNFSTCHDLMGDAHPGRIPGEIVAHVLYFFTKCGDVVFDPMAGSGTTADACLLMGRKCFAYDIDARHERCDIIKHDIETHGWPDKLAKAQLIFWDPPYFSKMDSRNIGDEGYIEGSISKLSRDDYCKFFESSLSNAFGAVKKGTTLAFLMSDWDDDKGKVPGIFLWNYANIIANAGWTLIRHIQVPLPTQQIHPDIVNKFRESLRLARLERYLLIARKT